MSEPIWRHLALPGTHRRDPGEHRVRLYVSETRDYAMVQFGNPGAGLAVEAWTTVEGLTRLRDKLNAVLVDVDG